jgi:hypothetical protein
MTAAILSVALHPELAAAKRAIALAPKQAPGIAK